ncbi:hypothetical protein [Neobacillus vireti]|uniref:hypothetical protein n=1 Tax=Neobacillus vireti TaxID=220686 RepID=UPI003000A773
MLLNVINNPSGAYIALEEVVRMIINKRKIIASVIGIVGSLMGLYLWRDYLPQYHGDTIVEWKRILRLEHVIFLYIPSAIALVASIFHKKPLMLLAFLLSLPATKYLGVNGFIDTFPLTYYPLICYIVSLFLMMDLLKKH